MALPVHDAAKRNDVEALRQLLDADPGLLEAEDEWTGRCPLSYACEWGSVEAAQLLLDRAAGTDKGDRSGWTPLMWACEQGYVEVVSLLLARGADPSVRSGGRTTALTAAALGRRPPGSDHVAVLQLLLKDGRAPVDARDGDGWTALYWACENGYTERARVLLVEGGADHTITANNGVTPMGAAERKGHDDCVRLIEVRGQGKGGH